MLPDNREAAKHVVFNSSAASVCVDYGSDFSRDLQDFAIRADDLRIEAPTVFDGNAIHTELEMKNILVMDIRIIEHGKKIVDYNINSLFLA